MATKAKAQQETTRKPTEKASQAAARESKAKVPAKAAKGAVKAADAVPLAKPGDKKVKAADKPAVKPHVTAPAAPAGKIPKPKSKPKPKPAAEIPLPVPEKALEAAPAAVTVKSQKWLEIRAILTAIKEDALREISKTVRNGTDAAATIEPGGDIYDQASSERDRELGLLLGDREREKLRSIDEALLRIEEGDYGICEECDEDIPLGRLKAMPFTRHCVKCKSDLEKMQAQTRRVEEERAYREIPLGADEDEG